MEFNPRVEQYSEDAAHLGEMLGFFRGECADYLEGRPVPGGGGSQYDPAKGWERRLADGRYCLTQFPHGHATTTGPLLGGGGGGSADGEAELRFVGFLGRRLSDLAPGKREEADVLVAHLMRQMCQMPDILLYGTSEWSVEDDNHYNLVVLRSEEAGRVWKEGEPHRGEAINNLSPQYYTSVRIHTGVLPHGLDSKELLLKRSVFLDYKDHQRDPSAPIHREEKHWAE